VTIIDKRELFEPIFCPDCLSGRLFIRISKGGKYETYCPLCKKETTWFLGTLLHLIKTQHNMTFYQGRS